jgi:hypothetical protein
VGVDQRLVGGLGELVGPGKIVGVEGALGLGDQLLGPAGVRPGPAEEFRLPARHREAVERPVLDQGGFRAELVQDPVPLRAEAAQDDQEDREDDDDENDRDRDENEDRA